MSRYLPQRGFTLLELLMVVALVSVLVALGMPSMRQVVASKRVDSWRSRLHVALNTARSHAVYVQTSTVICARAVDGGCAAEGGRWHQGWLIFEDPKGLGDCQPDREQRRCSNGGGQILRRTEGNDQVVIGNNQNIARRVRYNTMGLSYGYTGRFVFCARHADVDSEGLVISNMGRVRYARDNEILACPNAG